MKISRPVLNGRGAGQSALRPLMLLNGLSVQYQALDQAIRTTQFIRNKAIRLWRDEKGVNKARISVLCKELAREFPLAKRLNSMAPQASAERAWLSISNFYRRCRSGEQKKGYPQFKKHSRSVDISTPLNVNPERSDVLSAVEGPKG